MPNDLRCRYDRDTRRRAIGLFERGFGAGPTAASLGIPMESVKQWLYTYRAVGSEVRLGMGSSYTNYTWEQKCAAAREVVDEGCSWADAMAKHGIASLSPLKKWCKAYREGGEEALRPKPKGRPKGAAPKPKAPMTREEELEVRLRKLEAENAYLKKLAALRAEETLRTGSNPRW